MGGFEIVKDSADYQTALRQPWTINWSGCSRLTKSTLGSGVANAS